MSDRVNAAVIGLGGNGRGKLRVLTKSPHIEHLVGADISEEARQRAGDEFGIEVSHDWKQTVARRDIGFVLIATPNHLHAEQSIAAMRAGKAVLCEKPMANTPEDAREMVRVAKETGVFFQIGFELRYSKLYMMVKEKIDAGELGEVRHVHCLYTVSAYFPRDSWRVKAQTGGDMFGEKLSHDVDVVRWWNGGKVADVYATRAPNVVPHYETADNYEVTYTFDNGTVSHLSFMTHAAATPTGGQDDLMDLTDQGESGHNLRYIVVGTKGVCETSVFGRFFKFYRFRETDRIFRTELVETHRWEKPDDSLYFHNGTDQYLDVARRIATGAPPSLDAEDSLATTELCFEIEAQAQGK